MPTTRSADPFGPTDQQAMAAVARLIGDPGVRSKDSDALLTDILDEFGGTKLFARKLRIEYDAAKPGSIARQKILEMIQRLIIYNTTTEAGRAASPSDMTDDELQEELQRQILKAKAADGHP